MTPGSRVRTAAWVGMVVVSVAVLGFGLVAVLGGSSPLYRADGLALVGLGLFGGAVSAVPFREGRRWAWWVLWFYPVFWLVHLLADLPPGKDHVHQVVFVVVSVAALLVTARTAREDAPAAG